MAGEIQGWTRSINTQLKLQKFKSFKLTHRNILLLCPHLIDFMFPKRGEIVLKQNK